MFTDIAGEKGENREETWGERKDWKKETIGQELEANPRDKLHGKVKLIPGCRDRTMEDGMDLDGGK